MAQSFDRVAVDLDRLAELNRGRDDLVTTWLAGLLPAAGRHAIDLGCGLGRHAVLLAGRFEQVDAIDLSGPMIELARARQPRPNVSYRQGDLHHAGQAGHYNFVLSVRTLHRVVHRAVPLRPRLHALAVQALALNLVRRGPRTAWQIYRLTTRPAWLDHRVSDRFFSREELIRCCDELFPGYRLDILGGPRGLGLVWDFA